ncbi:hypothetical protein Tco_0282841 [Tanacetum coccineum]
MANEGDKNVGGASGIVVDENRGREESCQGDKRSRGASRDTERVKKSHRHLEALGSDFAELWEDFKSALNVLRGNLGCEIHDLRVGEEMEQYMEGVNIVDDASKIKTATRYLKDTSALWWRRRYGDIERECKHEEKSRLHKLKHSGTTREMEKTELERRGVQDLSTAIAHAQALIDLVEWRSRKPTNEDSGDEQVGGEKQVKDLDDRAQRPPRKEITKESLAVGAKNKVRVESPKIEAKSKRAPKVETKDEAKRLGLETMKDIGWIVNGDAKAISGVAQGVKPEIEG